MKKNYCFKIKFNYSRFCNLKMTSEKENAHTVYGGVKTYVQTWRWLMLLLLISIFFISVCNNNEQKFERLLSENRKRKIVEESSTRDSKKQKKSHEVISCS